MAICRVSQKIQTAYLSILPSSYLLAPLLFTGNAVIVAVHDRAGTIVEEELRLFA